MTQRMSRWMLAAVIAAAMVIASAGMEAAATIALDDDGTGYGYTGYRLSDSSEIHIATNLVVTS
jgi:hypothetical protein